MSKKNYKPKNYWLKKKKMQLMNQKNIHQEQNFVKILTEHIKGLLRTVG